jgi:hypothetical protein
MVQNGPEEYPGAKILERKNGEDVSLYSVLFSFALMCCVAKKIAASCLITASETSFGIQNFRI